jgi:hypothetical protein
MHTQNLRTEETIQGNFVTSRNLSLTDLVSQLKHYNPTHQKDALLGLRELISLHPIVLNLKLGIIFDATIPLMLDLDSVVRDAARQLFEFLFPLLTEVNHRITHSQSLMKPFLNFFMACLGNGLTHSRLKIRLFCVKLLTLCLKYFPQISYSFGAKILPYLISIHNIEDVNKGTSHTELQLESLRCLNHYLNIIFYENKLHLESKKHSHFRINNSTEVSWNDKNSKNLIFMKMNEYEKENIKIINHLLENSVKNSIYDLDSFESILIFLQSNLKSLVEMFIENSSNLTKEKIEILKFDLEVTYKLLYALEDIALKSVKYNEDSYMYLMKPFFTFYVKTLPILKVKDANPELIVSINTILLSILSFSFQVESSQMLLKWEEKFISQYKNILKDDLSSEDISYLLGVYKRICKKISDEDKADLFRSIFDLLKKKKSNEVQSIMLNFVYLMMKNEGLEIPNDILNAFIDLISQVLLSNQKDMSLFDVFFIFSHFSPLLEYLPSLANKILKKSKIFKI